MKYTITNQNNPLTFFDPFFDAIFKEQTNVNSSFMKMDVIEKKDQFEVLIDVPSVKKENINIKLLDGYLTISVKYNNIDKESSYLVRERFSGEASRSYFVGDEVTENDIKASLTDGVLSIVINKKEEVKNEPKMISIA